MNISPIVCTAERARLRCAPHTAPADAVGGRIDFPILLSDIDRLVAALQIPMMLRSYEELDFVRERLRTMLEKRLLEKDFIVLN